MNAGQGLQLQLDAQVVRFHQLAGVRVHQPGQLPFEAGGIGAGAQAQVGEEARVAPGGEDVRAEQLLQIPEGEQEVALQVGVGRGVGEHARHAVVSPAVQGEGPAEGILVAEEPPGGRPGQEHPARPVGRRQGIARQHGEAQDRSDLRLGEEEPLLDEPDPAVLTRHHRPVAENPGDFLHLRIAVPDEGSGRRATGGEADALARLRRPLVPEAADSVPAVVAAVEAPLEADVVQDEQAGGHPHSQAQHCDRGEQRAARHLAAGPPHVMSQHDRSLATEWSPLVRHEPLKHHFTRSGEFLISDIEWEGRARCRWIDKYGNLIGRVILSSRLRVIRTSRPSQIVTG